MSRTADREQTKQPSPSSATLAEALSQIVPASGYRCEAAVSGGPVEAVTVAAETFHSGRVSISCGVVDVSVEAIAQGDKGFDESVVARFAQPGDALSHFRCGWQFDIAALAGFTLHPVPFKVSLDGVCRSNSCADLPDVWSDFAEGWILENGEQGLLVMRLPGSGADTCFVPADASGGLLTLGSIGRDGTGHQQSNPFLNRQQDSSDIVFPTTRFCLYKGGWEEGVHLFRQQIENAIGRADAALPPAPLTYNTFHDFGQSYDLRGISEAVPQVADLGFQMLHLDPGWETVWGSCIWDEERMGKPEDLVRLCRQHALELGLWTSLHTPDPSEHEGNYCLDSERKPYYAEEFGEMRLYGVCPMSGWKDRFISNMGRLAAAGITFINSDFHDWPWSGSSCQSSSHIHSSPPSRSEWAEALNGAFAEVGASNPGLRIEMHDHVESGEYRTPVWYLLDASPTYHEKWAYEFMWTTHQDLLDGKLFALYHLRKAEPVPLYLHMNMTSDNENALAFWYVASCVTHIGVGGALRAPAAVREGYRRAFAIYREHHLEMSRGDFVGIDELTHLHIHPDGNSGLLLVFNLTDQPAKREVMLPLTSAGTLSCSGARIAACDGVAAVPVAIPPKDVAVLPLKFHTV